MQFLSQFTSFSFFLFSISREYIAYKFSHHFLKLNWLNVELSIEKDIPKQTNGFDCGIFVCEYAENISRKAKLNNELFQFSSILKSKYILYILTKPWILIQQSLINIPPSIYFPLSCVTCFYYSSIPVANELRLASKESKSCLILGVTAVIHGCSFVLWTYWKRGAAGCIAGWGVGDVSGAGKLQYLCS